MNIGRPDNLDVSDSNSIILLGFLELSQANTRDLLIVNNGRFQKFAIFDLFEHFLFASKPVFPTVLLGHIVVDSRLASGIRNNKVILIAFN